MLTIEKKVNKLNRLINTFPCCIANRKEKQAITKGKQLKNCLYITPIEKPTIEKVNDNEYLLVDKTSLLMDMGIRNPLPILEINFIRNKNEC